MAMLVTTIKDLSDAITKLQNANVQNVGLFQTKNNDVVLQCADHTQPKIVVPGTFRP